MEWWWRAGFADWVTFAKFLFLGDSPLSSNPGDRALCKSRPNPFNLKKYVSPFVGARRLTRERCVAVLVYVFFVRSCTEVQFYQYLDISTTVKLTRPSHWINPLWNDIFGTQLSANFRRSSEVTCYAKLQTFDKSYQFTSKVVACAFRKLFCFALSESLDILRFHAMMMEVQILKNLWIWIDLSISIAIPSNLLVLPD